jgi:hypothetical protein
VQLLSADRESVFQVRSVRAGGIDITDTGLEVRSGQEVADLEVEITGRMPIISGTVRTTQDQG